MARGPRWGRVKLQFDGWVFDADARQLLHGSEAVRLSPKAFELLGVLIARRPNALAKAQLKDLLWPETFVSDENLPSLVSEIRNALGDDPRGSRYARTVQRFGYAFCASVEADGRPAASPPGEPSFRLILTTREIVLPDGESVLGRSRDVAVWLDSSSVSRRHARIVVAAGQATIEDLDSKNGTRVQGTRIAGKTPLADGDEIRVGVVRLLLRRLTESPTASATGSSS